MCPPRFVTLLLSFVLLYSKIQCVNITGPSPETVHVEHGKPVTFFCNYTYGAGEDGTRNVLVNVYFNGTTNSDLVYTYSETGGSGRNDVPNPWTNYFASRQSDITFNKLSMAVSFTIQHTKWTDGGNYTWVMTVDYNQGESGSKVTELIIGAKPSKPDLVSRHNEGSSYTLECSVNGGKPSPVITIFNSTYAISQPQTPSPASVTVNVTSPTEFYCTASNELDTVPSDTITLPEPTTTSTISTAASFPYTSSTIPGDVINTLEPVINGSKLIQEGDPGLPAGLSVGIVVFLVAIFLGGFFLYKKFWKKRHTNRAFGIPPKNNTVQQEYDHIQLSASQSPQEQAYTSITLQSWEINMDDIELREMLGSGHFGNVYKGVLKSTRDTRTVAVKKLKDQATETDRRDFIKERETMELLPHHENVVAILGYSKTAPMSIILEYLGNGNLKSFLRKSRSNNIYGNLHGGSNKLTCKDLLSFALDSAKGMAHIAKYKFLHRDLAARNILLSDNMVCKVSDFGLARDVINSREYLSRMETPLPIRWMSPESLCDSVYTTQSDVWSYGVLLWEIVTLGATPYPGITSGRELLREIQCGYRMEKPQHCTQELYEMMTVCWNEEPEERPTFDKLVTSLKRLLDEEMTLHVDVDRAAEAVYSDIDSQLVGEVV